MPDLGVKLVTFGLITKQQATNALSQCVAAGLVKVFD